MFINNYSLHHSNLLFVLGSMRLENHCVWWSNWESVSLTSGRLEVWFTVTSQYPSWYDARCCKDVKLQQSTNLESESAWVVVEPTGVHEWHGVAHRHAGQQTLACRRTDAAISQSGRHDRHGLHVHLDGLQLQDTAAVLYIDWLTDTLIYLLTVLLIGLIILILYWLCF